MNSQCQARTHNRTRCQCRGVKVARVTYCDGIREFRVCQRHYAAVLQQTFRPAINPPVLRELTPAEKISGLVSAGEAA